MRDKRQSIQPTYDSRETGPRYWITSTINGKPVVFMQPVADPFVRHTVHVGWRDLLKSLFAKRGLQVEFTVGGERDVIEDVMELDSNYLGTNCTRRDVFNQHINERLGAFGEPAGQPEEASRG